MVINSEATVIKNAGSHFLLSELPLWKPIPAVLKGKVRLNEGKSTNPIACLLYTSPSPRDRG